MPVGFTFEYQIIEFVNQRLFKLLVNLFFNAGTTAFEPSVKIFHNHDGVIFNHQPGDFINDTGQITCFQLFDGTDFIPALTRLTAFPFAHVKFLMIIKTADDVETLLQQNPSFQINAVDIDQVTFSAVNADHIDIGIVFEELPHHLIQFGAFQPRRLKIYSNRHMERKLPFRKAFILDQLKLHILYNGTLHRCFQPHSRLPVQPGESVQMLPGGRT